MRYLVAPDYVEAEDFAVAALDVEADCAPRAAEVFVEWRLAELDYPEEIRVRVRPAGGSGSELFDVTVQAVPEATARPVKEPGKDGA